jgi:hypothetical protein
VLALDGERLSLGLDAHIHDISTGGLALIGDRPFPAKTQLRLTLDIPLQRHHAEVVVAVISASRWLHGDFVAHCRFVDISPDVVQGIEAWVDTAQRRDPASRR